MAAKIMIILKTGDTAQHGHGGVQVQLEPPGRMLQGCFERSLATAQHWDNTLDI